MCSKIFSLTIPSSKIVQCFSAHTDWYCSLNYYVVRKLLVKKNKFEIIWWSFQLQYPETLYMKAFWSRNLQYWFDPNLWQCMLICFKHRILYWIVLVLIWPNIREGISKFIILDCPLQIFLSVTLIEPFGIVL